MLSTPSKRCSVSVPSGWRTSRVGMGLVLAEDAHVDAQALALQLVVELRHEAGGHEAATHVAVLGEALLLEGEEVLERDDVPLHARHLGDGANLARAVGE